MSGTLLDLVKELNTLSDDNLAARVIANSDVQWCLGELQDILHAEISKWISVKDRLPEVQKEVLIYLPEYDSVEIAALFTIPSMNLREWTQNEDAYMLDEVSYWMPLPEPPEEVRDDGKSKLD